MFKVGDYLVYNTQVCEIKEVVENYIKNIDYYFLTPVEDKTLSVKIPCNNASLRAVTTKKHALEIIDSIPSIETIKDIEDKNLETEYNKFLNSSDLTDFIKIIKTTYENNEIRKNNNKKIGERDNTYLKKAEMKLYNEFAISLNKSYEEVKKIVLEKLEYTDDFE